MSNKPKPDDRGDNVDRIQRNIDMTIQNIQAAEEMIANTPDEKSKQDLKAKNERRMQALDGMRQEIKDEAEDKEKGLL
jgi:small acid-soluble spore protein (thioredoxin-like protein)